MQAGDGGIKKQERNDERGRPFSVAFAVSYARLTAQRRNGRQHSALAISAKRTVRRYADFAGQLGKTAVSLGGVAFATRTSKPTAAKIQPRNSGGRSSPGFAVPCRAANIKMAPTVV